MRVTSKGKVIIHLSSIPSFFRAIHWKLSHPGITKSLYSINQFFEILNLIKRLKVLNEECEFHLKNKARKTNYGFIKGYIEADAPLVKLSSDMVGLFDVDRSGVL